MDLYNLGGNWALSWSRVTFAFHGFVRARLLPPSHMLQYLAFAARGQHPQGSLQESAEEEPD